jgi:hypothetical protein
MLVPRETASIDVWRFLSVLRETVSLNILRFYVGVARDSRLKYFGILYWCCERQRSNILRFYTGAA